MARVAVISSCLVRMANCNATSISRMELTPWDLLFLALGPNQKGILFHKPQSTQNYIDHLKHSLSLTLDFFPPLSGRLSSTDNDDNTMCFFVDCNDAGALFVHAAARGVSVADILEPTYTPEIVSSFFPTSSCEGTCLAVQVTELEDGVFIGCTGYYVIDGTSLWHFFNSWSEMSRGFDKISKTPVFDRRDNGLFSLPSTEINLWQKYIPPPPLLERVFYISKENLAKLKSKANLESGNVKKISSLQALSAHLWRSYTRFQRRDDDDACTITMAIGARGRIHLPEGYFGKAIYVATTAVSAAELLQRGLGFAAVKINEMVNMQTKEEVIKFVENWVKNPKIKGKGSFGLSISGSPLFNVYGNDFGWGKPIAARSSKMEKFDGRITLFPAAVAGGVDVDVSFAPEILQAMGDDAEFMEPFAAA